MSEYHDLTSNLCYRLYLALHKKDTVLDSPYNNNHPPPRESIKHQPISALSTAKLNGSRLPRSFHVLLHGANRAYGILFL